MGKKTIVYYTSNSEKPEFEKKIQEHLLSVCGDIPIVSVSQKRMDFGLNICIGEVGQSYETEFRQIKLGAMAAKTEYIIFAEADFLYPKEHFEFEPTGDSVYRNENVWVILCYRKPKGRILLRYHEKKFCNGSQICKRDEIIEHGFREKIPFTPFRTETACVSFKTGDSMTKSNHVRVRALTLPYWGDARDLTKKYVNDDSLLYEQ